MQGKARVIAISSLLILFAPLGIDLYLSAFEIIKHDFASSFFQVTDTLSIYIFTLGAGQLLFGGLSDRYGHRVVIAMGFALTIVSCGLIVLSSSIEFFMLCRFLQGLGASALTVSSFSQVRDAFEGIESARAYSVVNGCMNIVPTLAPFIGSYFIFGNRWHGVFYALLLFAIVIAAIVFALIRSATKKPYSPLKAISFIDIAKDRNFQKGILINSSLLSVIFTYVGTAPELLMNEMGLSSSSFGLVFGINAALIMCFSFAQSRLLKQITPRTSIIISIGLILSASMLLLFLSNSTTPLSFMFPIAIFSISFGSISGIASAMAMSSFANNSGKASALMGCSQMMLSSLISSALSHSNNDPRLALGYFMFATVLILGFVLQKELGGVFLHAR